MMRPTDTKLLRRAGRKALVRGALSIALWSGIAPGLTACRGKPIENTAVAVSPGPVLQVAATPVTELTAPHSLVLSGTLTGSEEANVAAGAAGKVLATFVERGTVVKKGGVLARLDSRTITAQAQEATAHLESLRVQQAQSQADCQRNEQLFQKGALSRVDYDRSRTQCESSKWSLSAAEARKTLMAESLRDAEIRAPFTGMVVERFVSAGEYVRPDSPVVTLVAVDSLRVELTVPEADVAQIRSGMDLSFQTTTDDNAVIYRAKTRYVGPSVRRQTRDAIVEAIVDNAGHELRPGMFVTAKLALGEQTLPAVPRAALREDGSLWHVFAVVDARLEERLVQIDDAVGDMVPIRSGLKKGEIVVATLTPDLRDGARVNISVPSAQAKN